MENTTQNCSIIFSDSAEIKNNPEENSLLFRGNKGIFEGSVNLKNSNDRLVVSLINECKEKIKIDINVIVGSNCFLELRDETDYNYGSDISINSLLEKKSVFELFRFNQFNRNTVNSFNHNIDLSADCEFRDFNFSNGSEEMNNRTTVSLNEQNASYVGSGVVISNSTHSKSELNIKHLSKSAKSDSSFKTVSRGRSNITFNGMVFVDRNCSETVSNQISKGLVMDEEAKINLTPMLDINNDDVVCAHGAASGKPDENILFYLKSRGISKEDAEKFYIEGFLGEFIYKISNKEMQMKAFNYISSVT